MLLLPVRGRRILVRNLNLLDHLAWPRDAQSPPRVLRDHTGSPTDVRRPRLYPEAGAFLVYTACHVGTPRRGRQRRR